ncbi:zeta toxin [Pedobacter lusitanus]|uniref:Contig155, whole genome shotgun sequence n=1 Tax=Pedobacter lusitanus TaxID=1503925 RepID=A0A0D0GJL6_9SPHI|nr:zeta toxin family protein [Pedobacter lusitanus]KIO74621.1 zeta toxin [Pedobacter lusitanus]
MPNLYIVSGCNDAGKTTASYTILPEILNCREFVNADNIAAGLSPFNPESVAFESGRIMLNRIRELMAAGLDFAFETTLATRSYVSLVKEAHRLGYKVSLLYFWLSSPDLAIERVAKRVSKGGHHIPSDVIVRRYYRGIYNLYNLYMSVCDQWTLVDNTYVTPDVIAKFDGFGKAVYNNELWNSIIKQQDHGKS